MGAGPGSYLDAHLTYFLLLVGIFLPPAIRPPRTPILMPDSQRCRHFDPISFGVVMIANLSIGCFTPPFGVNIFVAQAVFKESVGVDADQGVMLFIRQHRCVDADHLRPFLSLGPWNGSDSGDRPMIRAPLGPQRDERGKSSRGRLAASLPSSKQFEHYARALPRHYLVYHCGRDDGFTRPDESASSIVPGPGGTFVADRHLPA